MIGVDFDAFFKKTLIVLLKRKTTKSHLKLILQEKEI
jgi:hypothetical protein